MARVVRLGVFVASTPEFHRQSAIANGASDLIGAGTSARRVVTRAPPLALRRCPAVLPWKSKP
ncbi:hypothetical protein ACU4GH_31595 [Bradyrhizobium betae]